MIVLRPWVVVGLTGRLTLTRPACPVMAPILSTIGTSGPIATAAGKGVRASGWSVPANSSNSGGEIFALG